MKLSELRNDELPQYTVKDYEDWEGDWELIKGVPFAMAPSPKKKHQRISFFIAVQLDDLLSECQSNCVMYQEMDWQVADNTVVKPDVLVVCDDSDSENRLEITPVIVFEILSPSTSYKDCSVKYRLYQEAGVKYYCIVDPELQSLEVYQLKGELYRKDDELNEGKISFDIGDCHIALEVKKLFSR